MKPDIYDVAIGRCSREVYRGRSGWRVWKDIQGTWEILRDGKKKVFFSNGIRELITGIWSLRKSDGSIVAMMRVTIAEQRDPSVSNVSAKREMDD